MIITARSNEKVKLLRRLINDKKERQSQDVYVAEGKTLLTELPSSCPVSCFFLKSSLGSDGKKFSDKFPEAEIVVLSDDVFDTVSDTVSPSGVIAVIKRVHSHSIEGDTVVLMDGVSDAGNVGSIIRTASARGIKTVICVHSCADPFSPKAVRASMGGIFKVNAWEEYAEKALELLKDYRLIALDMNGVDIGKYETQAKRIVIAVGNEAHGLSDEIRKRADDVVSLPMEEGGVESLNASVAAGIAMYMIKKGE